MTINIISSSEAAPTFELTPNEIKIRDMAIDAMSSGKIAEVIPQVIETIKQQGWVVEYTEHPYGVNTRNSGKFFPNSKRLHVLKTNKPKWNETIEDLRESELIELVHEFCMGTLIQHALDTSEGDMDKATEIFLSGYTKRLEVDEQVDEQMRDPNKKANSQFGTTLKRQNLENPENARESAKKYLTGKIKDEELRQRSQEWWDKINAD